MSRVRGARLLQGAGVGLAGVWVGLLLLTPYWASVARPGVGDGRRSAAALVWLAGSRVCHQRPDRSFHLRGQPLPVCGRCTGLYFAGAVGLLASLGRRRSGRPAEASVPTWWLTRIDRRAGWLAVAAIPTVLTWGLEVAGVWQPGTPLRALASVPLGVTAGWFVGRALE